MSFAKKLLLALAAAAAFVALPASADSYRGHGYYDRPGHSYRHYDRDYRDYHRDARWHRHHKRDRVVVVERPRTVVVERPVYVEQRPYYDPPPAAPNTIGSIIGAVIDYVDQRQSY